MCDVQACTVACVCEWQERARCKGEEQSKRWQKGIQLGEPRRMLRDISSQLGRKLAATVAVTLAGRIGLADERASKRCDFRCGSQLSGRLAETGRADDARHHRSGSGTAASGMEAASRQAHIPQARRLHFGRPTLFLFRSVCAKKKGVQSRSCDPHQHASHCKELEAWARLPRPWPQHHPFETRPKRPCIVSFQAFPKHFPEQRRVCLLHFEARAQHLGAVGVDGRLQARACTLYCLPELTKLSSLVCGYRHQAASRSALLACRRQCQAGHETD